MLFRSENNAAKIAELQARQKELDKQRTELENLDLSLIHIFHSEKDILKLVTTLIANTKGEGKGGDDFWVKAETLLFTALIGYIHYEAPTEEQMWIRDSRQVHEPVRAKLLAGRV